MDAIDTNYQSMPELTESKSIEYVAGEVKEFAGDGEVVASEIQPASFENLMDSIFENAMKEVGVKEESDKEHLNLLTLDEVDEDVNSLVELLSKENGKMNKKDELFKTATTFVEGQENSVEEVPFVEIEIDVLPSKKEDKKDAKIIKDKKDVKIEEKEEKKGIELTVKDEELGIKSLSLIKQKKPEIGKPEIKKQEIKKEDLNLEEVSSSTQKTSKPKMKKLPIVVEDLRTKEEANVAEAGLEGGNDAPTEDFSYHYEGESLNDVKGVKEGHSEMQGTSKEGGFASILAEQLKANSAQIVERGKIVLKDGNVGEIRLQLKPEHLGSVRIELKLSGDKKMQGEVTVSSKDAYDAFEDSLGELVSAFENAGFDASSFNLNWKNRGNEEIVREDLTNQYFSPEKTHQSLSEKLNLTENIYGFGQAENLNILA